MRKTWDIATGSRCKLNKYCLLLHSLYLSGMPVRRAIAATEGIYFITFTCTNQIPLFTICNAFDVVYKWFDYLKTQQHYIIGYVIMPNHVHAVIAFSNTGKIINTIVGNGKHFMAYGLVERLRHHQKLLVLNELTQALNDT